MEFVSFDFIYSVCPLFYGLFSVHFHNIENNDIQRMHLVRFIRYINAPICFGPSGPSSGSILRYKTWSNNRTMCGHYKTWYGDKTICRQVVCYTPNRYVTADIAIRIKRLTIDSIFKNILTFMRRPDHILFYHHIMFYSDRTSTLSLTSALNREGVKRHSLFALLSGEIPGTHCIMGPRAGLDGCGKSNPYRDSIPGTSSL
jgi:hypothetical protein